MSSVCRRLVVRVLVSGPIVALLLVAPGRAHAKSELSAAERARLTAGEVVVHAQEGAPGAPVVARAFGVVEAAPAAVWPHIDACDRYSEFMPQVAESREVRREGENVTCYVRIDMPFPMDDLWSESEARHRALDGERFLRRWKGTKGSYRVNEGSWVLAPWGEGGQRTLVVYTVRVRPKAAVPDPLLRAAQKRSLPGLIAALRERVARSADTPAAPSSAPPE